MTRWMTNWHVLCLYVFECFFFISKFPARIADKVNLSKGKSQVFSEPILIEDSLPYGDDHMDTIPTELPAEDLMARFNREIPELEMTPERNGAPYPVWYFSTAFKFLVKKKTLHNQAVENTQIKPFSLTWLVCSGTSSPAACCQARFGGRGRGRWGGET